MSRVVGASPVTSADILAVPGICIAEAIAGAGIARDEASILLRAVTGASRAHLIAHADDALSEAQSRRFAGLVRRRRDGEPVAYLVGCREFYGFDFEVDSAVLIPRPETELLVDLALEQLAQQNNARLLDLGTGSGAIALALAMQRPEIDIVAVERSTKALEVAGRNLRNLLPAGHRVSLVQGDWYQPVSGQSFDLIVSNPPYVAAKDPHLSQGDLRFEPMGALIGGEDGLDAIREIVAGAARYLVPGGHLFFEHGYDQAAACRQLLEACGFSSLIALADLSGVPRIAGGRMFRTVS